MKVIRPNSKPQEMFLASDADIVVYGGAAGGGKCLLTSTKIPTPNGFVQIKDIGVGDYVFSEFGTAIKVTQKHEVKTNKTLYKVVTTNGGEVITDAEHLWSVFLDGVQKKLSTLSIMEYLANNKKIRVVLPDVSPVQYQHNLDLPVHPYLFGYWLGDGSKGSGSLTIGKRDAEETISTLADLGYEYIRQPSQPNGFSCAGVFSKLQVLTEHTRKEYSSTTARNIDKRIPQEYLLSSVEQRIELLRGIMDSDGYIDTRGHMDVTLTKLDLLEDIQILLSSLGIPSEIRERKTTHTYKEEIKHATAYRLYFNTNDFCPFRLKRKASRWKQRPSTRRTQILSVEECGKGDVVCIAVDNPTHLFLATDRYIPTHNTYAILLDTLRYMDDPNYRCVIFRRTSPQITSPGGLWDTASKVYTLSGIDGVPKQKDLKYVFPAGAEVKFSHMEHESDKESWQGSQLTAVIFDEVTHFTKAQITYMFSRLRSDANVAGYIRMTCNPDPDHPLREWIDWWIDKKTGLPIPERAGIKRYFVMLGDDWYWAGSKELLLRDPEVIKMLSDPDTGRVDENLIMSFTFIPATLADNKDMNKANPRYKAALMAMSKVDRERLLGGNWNVRASSGDYFKRQHCLLVERNQVPANMMRVRYWDRAATKPNPLNENPDYTVGLLMGRCQDGYTWILDMVRFRDTPAVVRSTVKQVADVDCSLFPSTRICLEKDPGQAGKSDAETLATVLGNRDVRIRSVTKAKLTRFQPFSAAAENGMVRVVKADWNDAFFNELEAFAGDGKGKDDIVDCCSGGYLELEDKFSVPDFILPVGFTTKNTFAL